VRSEYSIDANTPLILFVGSGFERKGVAEMLTLLSRIEKPFFAMVVGKDKKLQRYLEMSEQLGLADRVRFIGQKADIDRYYQDSDILLLPTHYEPFSNVVLEAMLYGNAVITTRQNGAAEVLQQDLIMDTPSDEKILPVLQKLVSEPDYLTRIKQQNMETVSGFTIEKNAAESVALIEQTLREINR
jgi:UDP-glucose:(heptosyl)LPS alpha-1,3-glucosyltransferase